MAPAHIIIRIAAIAALLALLAGCSANDDERTLVERLTAGSIKAPNEFAVMPQKPLQVPDDVNTLPPPTPGGLSRTDLTPKADAIRALSGREGLAPAQASDRALLVAMGAGQAQPGVRALLAQEDVEYRKDNRGLLLDRLFGTVTEAEIYDDQVLDPRAELARLRARGVRVPPMPPEE